MSKSFATLQGVEKASLRLDSPDYTNYYKPAAKAGLFRIPEATLLFFAAIGGAAAMYITMQLIRHKTHKPKFMISLPFFCAAHFALIYFCLKQ